ncbi:MAG: methyltransferase domain-containing protein [Verrucomicrobiales bacterium]|nr:methyltransferase domain-containing protein [Verrucomicrobiales bacterium]
MTTCLEQTGRIVWDPAEYAARSGPQLDWARELIARLELRGHERILDVGCGHGRATAELAARVPRGFVLGIDNSPEMIAFARAAFPPAQFPNLRFELMDARKLEFSEEFDIVFSNAALHWVDDHPAFLRGAAAALRPGGRLLVACGGKGNAHDVFLAIRAVIRRAEWRRFFRKMRCPYFLHSADEYKHWLPQFGFEPRKVELVEKEIVFADAAALAGWLRTTWLPYTQRVPEHTREEFIAAVAQQYTTLRPPDAAGNIRVGMVRLEVDAVKA